MTSAEASAVGWEGMYPLQEDADLVVNAAMIGPEPDHAARGSIHGSRIPVNQGIVGLDHGSGPRQHTEDLRSAFQVFFSGSGLEPAASGVQMAEGKRRA
jgi:hypothetical protein